MVQVRVNEGLLEGELVQNEYGGTYCSFKGIPYAQPPLGELRFKAPQAPKSWEGIRSAKEFGPKCLQNDMFHKGKLVGSEDCLYLNVYSPDVKPDKLLPVMFYIHGGGLRVGSGDDDANGPKYLVRQGVIVVTINYRLEVLGFLCLNTEDIPGNAGMKDQVQALRWVNYNIASFGGDPNNITIFGESAGGVSVSYHLMSPMTKGLFRRAICQSGVCLCYWGQAHRPRDRALALARNLGFYSEDDKALYDFFKNQPASSLIQASVPITFSEKIHTPTESYFNIVNEIQFGSDERFFHGNVAEVVSNGIREGVDIMTGYNSDEGLLGLAILGDINKNLELAKNFPQFFVSFPMCLDLSVNQQLELGKKIRELYFKNPITILEDWEQLGKFYAMDMIVHPTLRWTKLSARTKRNKIYLYKFTLTTELNIMSHFMGLASLVGKKPVVGHADDLMYLFNMRNMPIIDTNSSTFKHVEKVTKLWTNFAKYGNPTPDDSLGVNWTPYSPENQEYLDIGNELQCGNAPDAEEIESWEKVLTEFGQILY